MVFNTLQSSDQRRLASRDQQGHERKEASLGRHGVRLRSGDVGASYSWGRWGKTSEGKRDSRATRLIACSRTGIKPYDSSDDKVSVSSTRNVLRNPMGVIGTKQGREAAGGVNRWEAERACERIRLGVEA